MVLYPFRNHRETTPARHSSGESGWVAWIVSRSASLNFSSIPTSFHRLAMGRRADLTSDRSSSSAETEGMENSCNKAALRNVFHQLINSIDSVNGRHKPMEV